MGAWGPAIFSDDTACDIRSDYREMLEHGLDDHEATQRVIADHQHLDPDEAHVLWLALAAAQTSLGRLDAHVKANALGSAARSGDTSAATEGVLRSVVDHKEGECDSTRSVDLLSAPTTPTCGRSHADVEDVRYTRDEKLACVPSRSPSSCSADWFGHAD